MQFIDSLFDRIRSFPNNILFVLITFSGVVFSITTGTPTTPPISDFEHYVDMANGLEAPDPFGKRILVPFLIGLMGGDPFVFHYVNLVLLVFAAAILYLYMDGDVRGLLTGLLFLGCTRAISMYAGEPSPDAMTYLLIALTLYLTKKDIDWSILVIAPLAAATHPICCVFVSIIWLVQVFPDIKKSLYLIPGIIVFLLLLPESYGTLFLPDLERILWIVKSINILWIGVLALRKNRFSYLVILLILTTAGFSLIATNVDRIFSFLGLAMAPLFIEILYPKEDDETQATQSIPTQV
ncbi:MAG: hypothetical protein ACTSV2_06735 [Candidatus Thorarchaeota archaeon]